MPMEQRLLAFIQRNSGGILRTAGEARLFLIIVCLVLIALSVWGTSSAFAPPEVDEAAAARAKMPPPPLSERRHGNDL